MFLHCSPYTLKELRADADSGWPVEATVFVECMSHYRTEGNGPANLRFIGETELRPRSRQGQCRRGPARGIAGIVSRADMTQGAAVEEVLSAHIDAGEGLIRGVRHATSWDEDRSIRSNHTKSGPGTMSTPEFAEGVRCLGRMGLSFDAWLYHPQIPETHAVGPECSGNCNHPRSHRGPFGRWSPCRSGRRGRSGLAGEHHRVGDVPECGGEARWHRHGRLGR